MPDTQGDRVTRGVVDAAMPEPERATAVLPVEADQPVAGGIEEAEERDIPARRPLRLQIERAARSYVRLQRAAGPFARKRAIRNSGWP